MSKPAHPSEVLYRSFDGTAVVLPEYYPTLPYGVGEPDPITYAQRPDWKFVNGHITAKDIELYEEAHAALGALLSEDAMNMAAYDVDSTITLEQVSTFTRLSALIEAGPCPPGCVEHDIWEQHIVNGKVVDVPVPELTVNGDDSQYDRWHFVPDVLVSYAADNRAVSLAQQEAGLDYVDQVWVDGVPYGVIAPEVDVTDEFLPTFRFQYRGSDVRAVCACGTHVTYSEVARKRGVLVEDPAANMQAFVAMLLLHANAAHANVTREDLCKHGFRRYVSSKSRSTGQPFKAKFCAARENPCDPIWVND